MLRMLENLLNRGLPRSPRAQQLCAELSGKTLAIEVADIVRVVLESTGTSLRLTRSAGPADAEIIGGPLGLLGLAGDNPQAALQARGVDIRGATSVAEKYRELALLLRPDLEEDLSVLVGDVPAHQIGRAARLAFSWWSSAASTAAENLGEYFAHERRDLVSRNEGEQFLKGVDVLREDLDRVEARLNLLTSA